MADRFAVTLSERSVGRLLNDRGYVRLKPRPQHPKADPEAQAAFKKNFPRAVAAALPAHAQGKPLEIWFQEFAMEPPSVRGPWRTPGSASRAR